ncbi:MAG: hypothetical protein GDA39_10725 [Hyphomonadaceae bacterium]|nr:hypothetical protein [Hyphomonadaceae bacterium]MBC6413292.1 hypothetical protein [Hyphomonadaceae bacterium]
MNPVLYFSGVIKALGQDDSWPDDFDLTGTGFCRSFFAIFLSVPCYFISAVAIQAERARVLGIDPLYPNMLFFMILAPYMLMFFFCAYVISVIFERMELFKPWVIVRHWAMFFAALPVTAGFGLYLLNLLPFAVAYGVAMFIYLGTLAIDIRLASRVAGFQWGPAVFIGCFITGMSMAVLLIGALQTV